MNDIPDKSTPEGQTLSHDVLLDLNFVPTWAREAPGGKAYSSFDGSSSSDRRRGGSRDDRKPYRDNARSPRKPGQPSSNRPNRRDGYKPQERRVNPRPRIEQEHDLTERPTVKISFIPEQKNLNVIVRKIRSSNRAYPLFDIAGLFMREPKSCLVIIESVPRQEGEKSIPLLQCKECKCVFLKREDLLNHALTTHMDKYYKIEEITTDPPSGNYPMVARCNLSGTLLGPPNYHGYQERLQELYQSRFSNMSMESFQKSIETVRDPELVEKWKQDASKKIVYRQIDQENAPDLRKVDAEREFIEKHAPAMARETHRVIINHDIASRMDTVFLKNLMNRIYENEQQHPFTMAMALRSAFRHMELHLFKTKGNATFVTAVKPRALDTEHIVESIQEVLNFLNENPGCNRQDIVSKLWPDASDEEILSKLSPLTWMIEKGHVIEFFNGTLAVPMGGAKPRKTKESGGKKQ